ncbi:mucin-2 [Amyelois transitella]|uniref:mucin-2 n=1 Tax=Amyelois transitella TaxID=680683 RepID=UPI0029901DF4|nr:mucin-2 [Amyelois transitella]
MPFVQRVVEPRFLSRTSLRDEDGKPKVTDEELQAVTNCTLSNALRQLASLVLLAEDIFSELTTQLQDITERSKLAQTKIEKIGEIVEKYDPKKVPVPEGSLSDFAVRKVHYTASNPLKKGLFTPDTRPASLRNMYEKATTDRLSASILDQLRKDSQYSPFLLCTPVLSSKRRRIYQKVDVDIETHIPSVVEHLRKWTSKEAVGDVTALPDASMRIASCVTLTPDELSEVGSGDDEPIDHRLPSPEEQLRVIASKFPPEVVAIDTSGKFFDRMCSSRKSLHIEPTGETDTVKRRTRTRKPRGKRRNTISGTDQKELREAIAGDTSIAAATEEIEDNTVIRSRSSDLLKKSPIDPVAKKGHFNSLKQWGKNRLKMIGRSPSASRDSFKDSLKTEKVKDSKSQTSQEDNVTQETVTMRKKRPGEEDRRTHQRCASYSSSEKSIGVPSSVPTTATINSGVKLRGTAAQRRLRRAGVREEPHSSSGNWSASSESGRTSIGSEITTTTVPPKSTTSAATSNNSLNLHHGPPSSIISRRRFLNTSGSGSVTSEGTLTPDIIHDLHEDLETSSEFSCDTEGYYTSFHMDSGLKTLKEEEVCPSTPLHTSNALSNSSNSQTLTAENEYELFGKGSTSTTTSSAGTVCTTLMAAGSDRSLVIGPTVPERKSSLSKMMRSRNNNIHSANASLDRSSNSSFSKSPFSSLKYKPVSHSFTEKPIYNHSSPDINEVTTSTITITTNIGNRREITAVAEVHTETELECAKKSTGTSSPDSGHNTSSSPIEDSVSSAHGKNSLSEQDYSESSDLEGTDRIERIRYKTTINSSRIPSLCVITPTNSDDESETSNKDSDSGKKYEFDKPVDTVLKKCASRPKLELPSEERPKEVKPITEVTKAVTKPTTQINLKASLQPFNNLMCKLKGVLPHKLSNKKSPITKDANLTEELYDAGDYVTIADVKNNNQKMNLNNRGIYGNNDIVKKNLQTVLSGKLPDTEYVSLNELPNSLSGSKDYLEHVLDEKPSPVLEEIQRKGAKVTLDSQGQVIFSSDTLKRRKGAHTTFEPGPFVQEINPTTTIIQRETADIVKITDETDFPYEPPSPSSKPTSPQLGKLIIKAPIDPEGPVTTEFVKFPPPKPSTIITASPLTETPVTSRRESRREEETNKHIQELPRVVEAITRTGAYVNIHDAEGVSLSPTKDDLADYRHSSADTPYMNTQQHLIKSQIPAVNLNALNPTLHRYNTAHLRGRHGIINYENSSRPPKEQPKFWTLPKRSVIEQNVPNINTFEHRSTLNYPSNTDGKIQTLNLQQDMRHSTNDESVRISPIDPRTPGSFKSSTPSNKETVVDLSTKLLSPVKSTMTNEELYAVIHKSKKKLNIKDSERAESPALSTISLSPVSSESSLYSKGSQRHPETGYLGDPRTRMSWSPAEKQHMPMPTNSIYAQKENLCTDRYGPVPQTSRLDFKKLLLQHSVKLNTLNPQNRCNKLSAVEQLKISKEKAQIPLTPTTHRTQLNILDLSGSPKTYTHRKIIKPNPQPPSPGRTSALIKDHKNTPKILLSPKSQWRFSSPRSDVLSTPIPEANNEDDNSNSSGEKHECSPNNPPTKTVPIVTNQHFGARRNLIPTNENIIETEKDFPGSIHQGVFPLNSNFGKSNISSHAETIQAKRAEFFNFPPEASPPKLSSFKMPAASSSSKSRSKSSPERGKTSPTTLETAL